MMANRFKPERMTMIEILDERLAFYRENGETGDLIRFTQTGSLCLQRHITVRRCITRQKSGASAISCANASGKSTGC